MKQRAGEGLSFKPTAAYGRFYPANKVDIKKEIRNFLKETSP